MYTKPHSETPSTSVRVEDDRLLKMRLRAGLSLYEVADKLRTAPAAVAAAEEGGFIGRPLLDRLESLYYHDPDL
jgi:transcriptional regulator with XRE-family HTH domain